MEANITNSSGICARHNTYSKANNTLLGGYEGIPHNLLINVLASIAMLALFFIIRRIAWRYSQAALLGGSSGENALLLQESENRSYNAWTQLFTAEQRNVNAAEELQEMREHAVNTSLLACVREYYNLSDADIPHVSGADAMCYIKLQRYLLVYLLIIAVPALAIVLPVNIHGGFTDSVGQFSSSTINNLSGNSPFLWLHAAMSGLYMVIAAVCLLHYSRRVVATDMHGVNASCLMIRNLPTNALDAELLMQHFREAYPSVKVESIDFAYDIRKLQKLHDEHSMTESVLQLCRAQSSSCRPTVTKCRCSWLCNGCCCGTEDAVQYYTTALAAIDARLHAERQRAKQHKLSIVFVQLSCDSDAKLVLKDIQRASSCLGIIRQQKPVSSSVSMVAQPNAWSVELAPSATDINWCNLPYAASGYWYLRAVIINAVVFLLLFFFTTPLYIVSLLKAHNPNIHVHIGILTDFLPTLFMWIFSSALPFAVYYSAVLTRHWTKSAEHYAVMLKCSIYLILMVLVLPSLGLSRADSLVEWLFSMSEQDAVNFRKQWQCVFVSENASFFVNYVITSGFIGCCAELLRLPEMVWYAVNWCGARSHAEARLVFKKVVWEYDYGFNFSWMLCIFAIVMTYSTVAPIILVFGIVYMCMKILADRYNIYYAYKASVMDRSVHRLAQSIALVCVLMGEVFVAGFFFFRIPHLSDARTVFVLLLILCSLCYLCVRSSLHLAPAVQMCCAANQRAATVNGPAPGRQSSYEPRILQTLSNDNDNGQSTDSESMRAED